MDLNFLHIGKCAGNEILERTKNFDQYGVRIHRHQHRSLNTFNEDWKYFFSIRDPITRFVSGFESRKRKGAPLYHNEWTPYEQKAFEYFSEAEDLAEALFSPSDADRALIAISAIYHNRMHQISYLDGRLDFSIREPFCIIRVEKFEQDFDFFKSKLGITADINPGHKHKNPKQTHPASELSKKARENLRLWYARDFEFYRYCERFIARQHSK